MRLQLVIRQVALDEKCRPTGGLGALPAGTRDRRRVRRVLGGARERRAVCRYAHVYVCIHVICIYIYIYIYMYIYICICTIMYVYTHSCNVGIHIYTIMLYNMLPYDMIWYDITWYNIIVARERHAGGADLGGARGREALRGRARKWENK